MLVTGRSSIVSGMVTAPPEPVYPVMVIAPLLVVYRNWACPAAGSAQSSNSGSSRAAAAARKPPVSVGALVVFTSRYFSFIFVSSLMFMAVVVLVKPNSRATPPAREPAPAGAWMAS